MIKLSPITALMLYLCITLASILAIWGWYHLTERKKKIIVSEKELLTCEYCHFAYLARRGNTVTQCPQCHSYNKEPV